MSVAKIKLFAIAETLETFKGMLWGQMMKVYIDHKNLIQDTLSLTFNQIYWWMMLLEEYAHELCTFRTSAILSPMQFLEWILDLTLHPAFNTST